MHVLIPLCLLALVVTASVLAAPSAADGAAMTTGGWLGMAEADERATLWLPVMAGAVAALAALRAGHRRPAGHPAPRPLRVGRYRRTAGAPRRVDAIRLPEPASPRQPSQRG